MRNLHILIAGCVFLFLTIGSAGAEKSRVAIVSPSPNLSMPWIAKEAGIFAKHGLDVDVILLTGSPRLVQSLIAGDVDYAVVGASATMRARMRGAAVVILAATTNVSSQKILVGRNSGIRQLEDLKGRVVGVSQYGSEADVFARAALATTPLRPEKDVTILQLGGHPQVAAALVAGKNRSWSARRAGLLDGAKIRSRRAYQCRRAQDDLVGSGLGRDLKLHPTQPRKRDEVCARVYRGGTLFSDQPRGNYSNSAEIHGRDQHRERQVSLR